MANQAPGPRLSNDGGSLVGSPFSRKLGLNSLKTAILAGDSISAYAEVVLSATSVTDNNNGTATVIRNSHALTPGDPVRVGAAVSSNLNVMDSQVLSVIDANTFTIALGGRTHNVTAPSGPTIAYPNRRSSRGWFTQLEQLLGENFNTAWCAVGGANSVHINSLVNATNITQAYDVGFVEIGMNDIYSTGPVNPTTSDYNTIWANIKTLIDNVKSRSSMTVVLLIPPRNSADPQWNTDRQALHTKLNRTMFSYAQSIGAFVVDTWRASQNGLTYVKASSTNPDPEPVMVFDNTHPSWVGAVAIGKAVASVVSPFMGSSGWKPAHTDAIGINAGNLFTDSSFSSGSGGVATGYAMNSTTTNMSVTPTLVARTVASDGDAAGYNQVIQFAYGTATGIATTRFRKSSILSLLTPGSKVRFKVPYKLQNASGVQGLQLTITGSTTTTSWLVTGNAQDSNTDELTGDLAGWLMSSEITIPTGLTSVDFDIRVFISSAQSASATLTLWQPELRISS